MNKKAKTVKDYPDNLYRIRKLDKIRAEIYKAPKETWPKLTKAVVDYNWPLSTVVEVVKQAKENPSYVDDTINRIEQHRAKIKAIEKNFKPLDQAIAFNKKIHRTIETINSAKEDLDWTRTGIALPNTIRGLYVLGEKVIDMIDFLTHGQPQSLVDELKRVEHKVDIIEVEYKIIEQ